MLLGYSIMFLFAAQEHSPMEGKILMYEYVA